MAGVRGSGGGGERVDVAARILPVPVALPLSPLRVAPHGGKLQLVTSSGVIAKSWFLE